MSVDKQTLENNPLHKWSNSFSIVFFMYLKCKHSTYELKP